jgi:hypothetical protein
MRLTLVLQFKGLFNMSSFHNINNIENSIPHSLKSQERLFPFTT